MKSLPIILLCLIGCMCFFLLFYSLPNDIEAELDGWEVTRDRNASLYINRDKMTATILPKSFCDQESLLVMMVISAPSHSESRIAIRETWGSARNVLGYNVSLYFLLGKTLNSSVQNEVLLESDLYGDIIQEDFIDSYNNLTLKSLAMLKLVSKKCITTTKYLLKIDDDMFVNVRSLVEELSQRNDSTNVLQGKLICQAKPKRDIHNKWYAPRYLFENETYPNYLSGTGYLMSVDVAKKLFLTAYSTPMLHLEDTYLTGICAKKANIKPQDNAKFSYRQMEPKFCVFNNLITMHYFNPQKMRVTFKVLNDEKFSEKCAKLKPTFSAHAWLVTNIFKANRTYRRGKCE